MSPGPTHRFGVFEANLQARELCKHGIRVRLSGHSFQVLALLLERPGEVVTRDQLRARLWSADTFVDFEHGLNTAVKKLRAALGDSPENPRYVETIPRVGYRFLAPVSSAAPLPPAIETESRPGRLQRGHVGPSYIREERARIFSLRRGYLAFPLSILAGLGMLYLFRPTVASPRVVRIRQITRLGTVEAMQTLVTDGPRVYFRDRAGGERSLKYVAKDGGEAYLLPTSSSQFDIDGISPDGSTLLVASVLFGPDNPLWALPTGGGSPLRLGDSMAIDSEWSPDGRKLAYVTAEDALYLANSDGTQSRKLADVAGTPFCPRWSPDSMRIRFVVIRSETGPQELWEVAADGKGGAHPLLPGWGKLKSEWGGSWSPDGKYFFFSSSVDGVNCVWALREKTDWSHKVRRTPVQLTSGPISYSLPRMSRDGKTLFVVGEERRGELMRYDLKTRDLAPFLPKVSADHVSFSRDGRWMAYVQYPEGTLWRSKSDGTERLQLTAPPLRAYLPRWSPDSKWIAFAGVAVVGGPPTLYRVDRDGLTVPEELTRNASAAWSLDWSPDGGEVIFGRTGLTDSPEATDLAVLDLKSKKVGTLPASQGMQAPQWSSDGRYLLARAIGSKRLKLYDSLSGRWTDLGVEGADYPSWSRDGAYIYFNTFINSTDPSVFRLRLANHKLQRLYTLNNVVPAGIYGFWSGVAPDGSLLILRDVSSRDIYAIDLDLP